MSRTDEQQKGSAMCKPDFLDLLIKAIAERVKVFLADDIKQMISEKWRTINAEDIDGLEEFIDGCFKEHNRDREIEADDVIGLEKFVDDAIETAMGNGDFKIDADNIEGLDEFIKETMKKASITF